jgi:glycosyltransferase involved in cell wall biosynthesis
MRVLFITLSNINSIYENGIYQDLMREFVSNGHHVDIMCPIERRYKKKTYKIIEDGCNIIKVRTLNIQKTNFFEKTISMLLLDILFRAAYFSFLRKNDYSAILISTPPITLNKFLKKVKNINTAFVYLLLKDIFPQNAVDLEVIKSGSFAHHFFKSKEDELYSISDTIGCMSPANKDYLLKNNAYLNKNKVEINANSINLDRVLEYSQSDKKNIRNKYEIPFNATCILFGGNLGKPQGISRLIKAISSCKDIDNVFFVIDGEGTHYKYLSNWVKSSQIQNVRLLNYLPKLEYLDLVDSIDVGLISLDYRFTIPNFPSRLLSYLEMKKPVLIYSDEASDMGRIAEENNFGFFARSDSTTSFVNAVKRLSNNQMILNKMGHNGFNFMIKNYTTTISYKKIMESRKKVCN